MTPLWACAARARSLVRGSRSNERRRCQARRRERNIHTELTGFESRDSYHGRATREHRCTRALTRERPQSGRRLHKRALRKDRSRDPSLQEGWTAVRAARASAKGVRTS